MSLKPAAYFYAIQEIQTTVTAWGTGNIPRYRSENLTARSAVIFIYLSNFRVMSKNLGKVLDYQRKQNSAVEKVIDFLSNYESTGMLYETLANAQVQILSLLRLCDKYVQDGQKWGEIICPNNIEDMLLDVNEVYKLLKPFEELARENGGGDVL